MSTIQLSDVDRLDVTLAKLQAYELANSPAPGGLILVTRSVNLNAAGDTAVPVILPTGFTRFQVNSVVVAHASTSLTTATLGVYTAASAGGLAIVTTAALSGITATTESTAANMLSMSVADTNGSTNVKNLYIHVGTAQGAAATADVMISITPIS